MKIWHNGAIVEEVRLAGVYTAGATHNGWLFGDGLTETILTIDGAPFALERHLDRLVISSARLLMEIPTRDEIRRMVNEIIGATKILGSGRLRLTFLTSGDYIATHIPATKSEKSARLVSYPHPRSRHEILSGIKSISYGENARALRYAVSQGADDVIFENVDGNVMESALANIMWGSGSEFFTTPLASGCLPGITRALLIESFGIGERSITRTELASRDGVYLLSSIRTIQAVRSIDGEEIPMTDSGKTLTDSFNAWILGNLNP